MDNNRVNPELNRIVSHIKDLPTLPRTVLKITALVNDPQASAKELSSVITDDQVLTARLLRLVNSSFYGFPQRIATVTNAIVLLGFDAIRNLLLTTSIFGVFSKKNDTGGNKLEHYWDHALGCAVGAKIIGNHINYDKEEELFVAGLLHDIGKIVEILFIPEEFEKARLHAEIHKTLIFDAEELILGYNHADIGELLAQKWNLPEKLSHIIAFHHTPSSTKAFSKEATIIHFADILCRSLDLGSGGDSSIPRLDLEAWKKLEIKQKDIRHIMEKMEVEFQTMKGLFDY
jgi:HD-like signal output (HDOD) protein